VVTFPGQSSLFLVALYSIDYEFFFPPRLPYRLRIRIQIRTPSCFDMIVFNSKASRSSCLICIHIRRGSRGPSNWSAPGRVRVYNNPATLLFGT
jgi:hypothetical protein